MTNTVDEDLFLKGLEQRKATLGATCVERNLAAADYLIDVMVIAGTNR